MFHQRSTAPTSSTPLEWAWTRVLSWGGVVAVIGLAPVVIAGHGGWAVGAYASSVAAHATVAAWQLKKGRPRPVPLVVTLNTIFFVLQPFIPFPLVMGLNASVLLSAWVGVLAIDRRRSRLLFVGSMEVVLIGNQVLSLLFPRFVGYDGAGIVAAIGVATQALTLAIGAFLLSVIRRHLLDAEQVIAEKDRLISGIAHAVRTPLTSVVGFASLMADTSEERTEDEARELTERILGASTEASHTVDDLLVRARDDIGTLESTVRHVDVRAFLQATVADLPESERARIVVDDGTATAHVDPQRLRHLIRNLVTSALHATEDTIRIAVAADAGAVRTTTHLGADASLPRRPGVVRGPYDSIEGAPHHSTRDDLRLDAAHHLAHAMGGHLSLRGDPSPLFEFTLPSSPSDRLTASPRTRRTFRLIPGARIPWPRRDPAADASPARSRSVKK